jgi:hypothetical protein
MHGVQVGYLNILHNQWPCEKVSSISSIIVQFYIHFQISFDDKYKIQILVQFDTYLITYFLIACGDYFVTAVKVFFAMLSRSAVYRM